MTWMGIKFYSILFYYNICLSGSFSTLGNMLDASDSTVQMIVMVLALI
jgi:hypothetical protein